MAKPGYLNLPLTEETDAHIEAICKRLGLDPANRGAKTKAVDFALRVVALKLVEVDDD